LKIGIPQSNHADVEVEIDDRLFGLTSMTRTKQLQLDAAEKALEEAKTSDEVVERMAAVVSIVLAPVAGQKKPAGEVLVAMWQADRVDMNQLVGLLENIQAAAAGRPT
jgi:hypothetical protein